MKKVKKRSQLSIIYISDNSNLELEKKIRKVLLRSAGKIPIVSVSNKPIKFGKNISVGNVGKSVQNNYRKIQIGAMSSETPFVAIVYSNCLYPKEYFKYIPANESMCCQYQNIWSIYNTAGAGFIKEKYMDEAQIWGREILIRHIEKRLKGRGIWKKTMEKKEEIPTMFRRPSWVYFYGRQAVIKINFEIKNSLDRGKNTLPIWGSAENIRKDFFGISKA